MEPIIARNKMKLFIREYISMLKEDSELENLVKDLLNSMEINVVSSPQKGVRQSGVDIYASGG